MDNNRITLENEVCIFDLNHDCLLHIFSFFPFCDRVRIQRVCTSWQTISIIPWHDVKKFNLKVNTWTTSSSELNITLDILTQILSLCGKFLTHLELNETVNVFRHFRPSKDLFNLLKETCPNLRSLRFPEIAISNEEVALLADNFEDLTDLQIYCGRNVEEEMLSRLLCKNKKLQCLRIKCSDTIAGKSFLCLPEEVIEVICISSTSVASAQDLCNALKRFRKLHTFTLSYGDLPSEEVQEILQSINSAAPLKELRLNYIPIDRNWVFVHNVHNFFERLDSKPWENLETLQLTGPRLLNDITMKAIGTTFKKLSKVVLKGSSGLTEAGLSRIQYLPDLRELEISGLNNIINPVIRYTTLRVFTCHHSPCMLNSSIRRLMLFAENLESIELQCCPKVYIQYVINDALDTTKGRRIDQSLKIYFSSGIIRCGKFKEILTLIRVSRCVHVVTDESYVKNVADSSYQ